MGGARGIGQPLCQAMRQGQNMADRTGPWLADLHAAHCIEAAGVPGVMVPLRVWGAVARESARWGCQDPAMQHQGRARWLRCPTMDQQEGGLCELFGGEVDTGPRW